MSVKSLIGPSSAVPMCTHKHTHERAIEREEVGDASTICTKIGIGVLWLIRRAIKHTDIFRLLFFDGREVSILEISCIGRRLPPPRRFMVNGSRYFFVCLVVDYFFFIAFASCIERVVIKCGDGNAACCLVYVVVVLCLLQGSKKKMEIKRT